jgi:hypothetical protein
VHRQLRAGQERRGDEERRGSREVAGNDDLAQLEPSGGSIETELGRRRT